MRLKSPFSPYPVIHAIASILIATLSIQYGASLAKTLFLSIGPAQTSLIRLLMASLFLSLLWKPWNLRLNRTELKLILAYGISLGCMNFCFYLSLERIPLGIAVALEFTGPLALSLLSSRRTIDFFWAFLAIAGLILISPLQYTSNQSLDPLGMIYALLAGICWVFYIIFGQRSVQKIPGQFVTTLGMIVATLIVIPFAFFHGITSDVLSPQILGVGCLVGILSSALPYSLEMIALKNLPTQTFGILMSLEPAIAALIGYIFLQEDLTLSQTLSILLIMSASLGSAFTASHQKRRKNHPPQEIPS